MSTAVVAPVESRASNVAIAGVASVLLPAFAIVMAPALLLGTAASVYAIKVGREELRLIDASELSEDGRGITFLGIGAGALGLVIQTGLFLTYISLVFAYILFMVYVMI